MCNHRGTENAEYDLVNPRRFTQNNETTTRNQLVSSSKESSSQPRREMGMGGRTTQRQPTHTRRRYAYRQDDKKEWPETTPRERIVLDSNILISALIKEGVTRKLIEELKEKIKAIKNGITKRDVTDRIVENWNMNHSEDKLIELEYYTFKQLLSITKFDKLFIITSKQNKSVLRKYRKLLILASDNHIQMHILPTEMKLLEIKKKRYYT